MLPLDHFSHGLINPALAYGISFIGSLLGLRCAFHAETARLNLGWLAAAAVALGGTGIWVMHFTAMLGFTINGSVVHYDMGITLLSAIVAVVIVFLGLWIVTSGDRGWSRLALGGATTGLGVAAMHYLGMSAMHTGARITYAAPMVALSLVIAVVAATAALWFMLNIRSLVTSVIASLIMALAVNGMHYTAMAAMSAYPDHHAGSPSGAAPVELLTPLITCVALVVMALFVVVGLAELEVRGNTVAPVASAGSPNALRTTDPATLAASGRQWPRKPS
ncbi:MHYT domain-containing protein [Nocardia camponoti]|uniref:Membrane protein n=1 Tax=Nocardia camponoti TaxID=1616106 RepID=A0A917QTR5_9NOCA|nr:MHYT domain-containing protein [Nocardia camponoti]GGK67219.1 membrane protein [Nocardia camponoti]